MKNTTTTALTALLALSSSVSAQDLVPVPLFTPTRTHTSFSIDAHGPTNGTASCTGPLMFQGDVLRPGAPFATPTVGITQSPCIRVRGGFGAGTLQLGGYPAVAEVDALSYGRDYRLRPLNRRGSIWFSTDEFAVGYPQGAVITPSLETEAPLGEHAASVFLDTGLPPLPLPWVAGPFPNVQGIDGDGLANSAGYTAPGLGLVEPNFPGPAPDLGDNVDAVDVRGAKSDFVLFSLDSAIADPCSGGLWSGSAGFHGFSPAAVLASTGSGLPPTLWASPASLGLDLAGFGTDDLDALAVWDNGNKSFDPSYQPFSWSSGATDMLVFSVRRGSAVIGQPDSLFGDPIEEGDLLIPPVLGGVSPFPAILVAAENLGLATRRSGTAVPCAGPMNQADDLDALDLLRKPAFDCNGNGREDALDIVVDPSLDGDTNGRLDECQLTVLGTPAGGAIGGAGPLGFQ